MTERARTFLREIYGVPEAKIDLIAHGIPDMPFVDPNFYKDQFGVEGKLVALTFGLLSPNKGIEHMLRAMPAILKEFPNFVYIVLGATHPNLVREQGERYRLSLERLAKDLGIKQNVIFYNRFVELDELTEFIGAADIYVTPVPEPGADHLGHAGLRVRLRQGGRLDALLARRGAAGRRPRRARAVRRLRGPGARDLRAAARRAAAARDAQEGLPAGPRDDLEPRRPPLHGVVPAGPARAGRTSRSSRWRSAPSPSSRPTCPAGGSTTWSRMTDSTGIFQHATYTIPNFAEGYCTDDNARALLLTVLLEELGQSSAQVHRLATTYAAFLQCGLRPRPAAVPQLHELRPPLARGGRLGRLPRPGPLGAGRLRRPVAAAATSSSGPSALFELALPAVARDDLAPGLGLRPAGHPRVPPPAQRRPARPARSATP